VFAYSINDRSALVSPGVKIASHWRKMASLLKIFVFTPKHADAGANKLIGDLIGDLVKWKSPSFTCHLRVQNYLK